MPRSAEDVPADELLRRRFVHHGDQGAFRQLVHRHGSMVWQTARRRCRDAEDAAEVAQDVFIVLAKKATALRADSGLGPWLHRVTVILSAKAASHHLSRQRRHEAMMKAMSAGSITSPIPPSSLGIHLDEVLDGLPQADRQLLIWRYLDRLSLQDVARRLGKSEAACQKQSERTLARLRRRLQRQGLAVGAATTITALETMRAAEPPPSPEVWAKEALRSPEWPRGWTRREVWRHGWRRLPSFKWLAPAAALLTACWLLFSGQLPFDLFARQTLKPNDDVTRSDAPPGPPPPLVTTTRSQAPRVEPALTAERERRQAVRRELHLALLGERLGLDAAQMAEVGRLYDEHKVSLSLFLSRHGELISEVAIFYLKGGSAGPLSNHVPAFEEALVKLLRPDQEAAWNEFRQDLDRNLHTTQVNAYLAYWLTLFPTSDPEKISAARDAFSHLTDFDLKHLGGFYMGNTFYGAPFYEFNREILAGVLPDDDALTRFQSLGGVQFYASLPESFRSQLISQDRLSPQYEAWRASAAQQPPGPIARALGELLHLQATLLLTAEQAARAYDLLLDRARREPAAAQPALHLASDEDFFRQRRQDAELLAPLLSPLQRQVYEERPFIGFGIDGGSSLSHNFDAAAE